MIVCQKYIYYYTIANFLLLAPPTYAECISDAVDFKSVKKMKENVEIIGDKKYIPMYTYVDVPPKSL